MADASSAIEGVGANLRALMRDSAARRREAAGERLGLAELGIKEKVRKSEAGVRKADKEREVYLDTPSTLGEIYKRSKLVGKEPGGFAATLQQENPALPGTTYADVPATPRNASKMLSEMFQLRQRQQGISAEAALGRTSREGISAKDRASREKIAGVRSVDARKKARQTKNRQTRTLIRSIEDELFDLDQAALKAERDTVGTEQDASIIQGIQARRDQLKTELEQLRSTAVEKIPTRTVGAHAPFTPRGPAISTTGGRPPLTSFER